MSKHVGEKCGKLWRTDGRTDGDPDGRTDGHHHTIIRPVWRRAYKKSVEILYFWNCIICLPFTELGSIEELWENLIERKPSVDRDILQLACDGNYTLHLKCLLDYCFKLQTPLKFERPLSVKFYETFEILKAYNIEVTLTDALVDAVLKETKDKATREIVFRRFCNVVSYLKEKWFVLEEGTRENRQLKQLMFRCIEYQRLREMQFIMSCEKRLLDSKNKLGQTPILYAAQLKQRELVLHLAEEKPDIFIPSDDGTYLIDLIYEWDDVIQALIKVYNNILFHNSYFHFFPLKFGTQ